MSGLVVPVVVEGWQHECCGAAFAVGTHVAWRLVLRPWDRSAARVDLPVRVAPLAPALVAEWQALGNDAGRDPVVATHGGLVVLVHDAREVTDGRLRGVLQEDHHVDAPTGMDVTRGVVERVRVASSQYRHQGVRRIAAVPGTEELVDVEAAPNLLPDEPVEQGALVWRQTTGLLVDLRVDPEEPVRV